MGVKNYPTTPRVYVDMDGVLADFIGACHQRQQPPSEVKLMQNVYRNLEIIEGAREGIKALAEQGWMLFVLSKISDKNPYAATEKILWIHELFPEFGERIILSPDKGAVGRPQDFLVDDAPHWANAHNFPGTVLHFGAEGKHLDWKCIVEHLAPLSPNAKSGA